MINQLDFLPKHITLTTNIYNNMHEKDKLYSNLSPKTSDFGLNIIMSLLANLQSVIGKRVNQGIEVLIALINLWVAFYW